MAWILNNYHQVLFIWNANKKFWCKTNTVENCITVLRIKGIRCSAVTQSGFCFHCHLHLHTLCVWLSLVHTKLWSGMFVLAVWQAVTCCTVAGMLAISLRAVHCKLSQIFVPLRVFRPRCHHFLATWYLLGLHMYTRQWN